MSAAALSACEVRATDARLAVQTVANSLGAYLNSPGHAFIPIVTGFFNRVPIRSPTA